MAHPGEYIALASTWLREDVVASLFVFVPQVG